MKTQVANSTKIAPNNRLAGMVSLAGLFLMLCFGSNAWAQQRVEIDGHIATRATFGPGQPATIACNSIAFGGSNREVVFEYLNLQTWGPTPWFVQIFVYDVNGRIDSSTGFLLTPIAFPSGASFGASSFPIRIPCDWTVKVYFSNGNVTDTNVVPANARVELWGFSRDLGPDGSTDF